MRLISFNIENFRTIANTECYLADDITVLAGKNESGKSNVLKALECINPDSEFDPADVPLHFTPSGPPRIILSLELTSDEKEMLLKKYSIDSKKCGNTVVIRYNIKESKFGIGGTFYDDAVKRIQKMSADEKQTIDKLIESINTLLVIHTPTLDTINPVDDKNLETTYDDLENYLDSLPIHHENKQQLHPELHNQISELESTLKTILDKPINLRRAIWDNHPIFVMFSSFEDMLPDNLPYSDFINPSVLQEKYEIVNDLITLADLDVTKLETADRQIRENLTAKASTLTTTKFNGFWNQHPIEFKYSIDEPEVSIFIKDKGKEGLYKPEQRSKGFQWYLSFYLRLEAQSKKENCIILIDEPGLYLHPKAQQDVLNVLENLSTHTQVIYTTHSPYLIDPDNLNRVRLIVKDVKNNQTNITRSFHSGGDVDTITPIITAIGLDISRDLLFSKKMNVVMEGVSDYYYIRGMIEFLKKENKYTFSKDISLIPCMGHTTIGLIVSLLIGMELNFKIIFDNKGTSKTINKLKKDSIDENQIITVGSNTDDSIEDLFSDAEKEKYQIQNTTKGKVLISRDFYEKVVSNKYKTFSPKTISNFIELFERIS